MSEPYLTLTATVGDEKYDIRIEVHAPPEADMTEVVHVLHDVTTASSLAGIWNAANPAEQMTADRMELVKAQWDMRSQLPAYEADVTDG